MSTGSFDGTPIQMFLNVIINSVSTYKVSEEFINSNYPTWRQSIKEVFISMRLDKFIKIKGYCDPFLSSEKNEVTSFNITTYILNCINAHKNTQKCNHLTDPSDPTEILNDPFMCWSYLQSRHNEITQDKLTAVTKAFCDCKMLKTDTFTSSLDKFENLVSEYFYY